MCYKIAVKSYSLTGHKCISTIQLCKMCFSTNAIDRGNNGRRGGGNNSMHSSHPLENQKQYIHEKGIFSLWGLFLHIGGPFSPYGGLFLLVGSLFPGSLYYYLYISYPPSL